MFRSKKTKYYNNKRSIKGKKLQKSDSLKIDTFVCPSQDHSMVKFLCKLKVHWFLFIPLE